MTFSNAHFNTLCRLTLTSSLKSPACPQSNPLVKKKQKRKKKRPHAGDWSQFTAVLYLPTPLPSRVGRVYRAAAERRCVSVRRRERSVTHGRTLSACLGQRHRTSTPPRQFRTRWSERRGKQGAPWNGVKSVRFAVTVFRSRSKVIPV